MKKRDYIVTLKKMRWGLLPEINEWYRSVIFGVPGKTGEFLRRLYAVKHFKKCGKNLKIYPHSKVYNPQNLIIGDDVNIADFVQISAGGGVVIGNNVGIGPYVKIWSINHKVDRIDIPIFNQGWSTDSVIIEDEAWIGMGAIILPGAHISKGAVISAGSLLGKKPIPQYAIVSGNPGRVIGYRNSEKKRE